MNPFDLKSVLLARHAQHVVLIHFPIALFLVSVAFDFAAQWWRTAAFAAVAYYNLTVAAFASVPAVATGLMAWHWQLEGQKIKGTLLLHLLLGLASTAVDLAGVVGAFSRPQAGAHAAHVPIAFGDRGGWRSGSHRSSRRVPERR